MLLYLHLVGRILFGLYFVHAGYNHFKSHAMLAGYAASKKVPSASFAVYLSGVLALVAGLGIVFNMYTQIAYILVIVFLVPVTFMIHNFWTQTDPAHRSSETVSFQKNLALIAAALMLL